MELAMLDASEFWLSSVKSWLGHSSLQTSIRLLLVFDDNSEAWTQFDNALIDTEKVDLYIRSHPELYILCLPVDMRKKYIVSTNAEVNPNMKVGYKAYVDLRYFGFSWFEALDVPDTDSMSYIVEFEVTKLLQKRRFAFRCRELDDIEYKGDNYFLCNWGHIRKPDRKRHIVVSSVLVSKYPSLKSK